MADYYFGCYKETGHFIFEPNMRSLQDRSLQQPIAKLDGYLPPLARRQFKARIWFLEDIGFYALSFWDNTVDMRGGSHSTFLTDAKMDGGKLLSYFEKVFPEVFERLPNIEMLQTEYSVSTTEEVRKR